MAYTYTGTPNQRIEQAKRRISTEGVDVNATLSAYQNRIAQIQQQEQTQMMPEAQYQPSGNVGERLGDTLGEFFKDVATGVEKAFEGIADFGAGAVGVVAGWAGNNELKQEMTDFVARDLVEEQWEAARRAGLDVDFDDSYINELSETGQSIVKGVAQGIGQMLPTIVVTAATAGAGTAATAAGTLTSAGAQALTKAGQVASLVGLGASAAGRGTEEALNTEIVDEDGNVTKPSLDRAYLYGLATGAVEMATEKLVGGAFSKVTGAGALDNLIAKLAKSAKFSKAVKFGLDAVGEGVEEMVASSVEKTLQTIYTSSDGKVHWESPDIQDVFVSGVVGTLTSSVMGGGQIAVRKASSVASTQDAILDIQNSIEKANNLSKNGKLAEQAESLEAEINKATTEISRRYQRASDKGKAKIMQIEGIQNYITEDGEVRSTALEEGAVEITREQAVGTMSGSLALTRRNEVANVLKAQKAQIANALDETQKANFTKLEKMLDLSGKTSGNQLKVVAVESMPSNAFIKDDIVYISKDRLSDANDTARDFAHEVFHFAEGTSEYRQVAKFFDGVSVSGKKLFDLALEEVSTLGYDVDSRIFELIKQGRSAKDIVKAGYDSSQVELALSEIRAKQSETLFGDADVINRLAESNQSLAKKILTRIKDCIKILDAVFKGEKDTLETIKTMRKAEKLWMDALAVAGQKRSMATPSNDVQESKKGYAKRDESSVTRSEYNHHYWATANDVLSRAELGVLGRAIGSLNNGEYYEQTSDGLFMIPVGENGVLNKIVFTDGKQEAYSIDKVIEIYSDNETDLSDLRGVVYEREEIGIHTENSQLFKIYTSDDVRFNDYKRNVLQNQGNSVEKRNGSRSSREVESTSKIKHSLRGDVDSQGRHLSKEQIEYFKDSKVVNENGNLLVVYHGTGETFTRFSRNMIYFSDNADVADSYARDGKEKMTGYLNITKPFVIDAKGSKWSRVPLSDNAKRFLDKFEISSFYEDGANRTTPADIAYAIMDAIEAGADYDGVIIRNVDDTGRYWKKSPTNLGTDYIAFDSSQFKNIDNTKPTINPDIRFSKRSSDLQKAKDRVITMIDGWQIGAFGRHFIKIDNTKNFFAKGSLGEQLADQILVMANEGDPIKYAYATDLAEQIVNRAVASNIDPQLLDIYLEEATAIKEYMHKFELSGIRDEIKYRYGKKESSAIYLVWQSPKNKRGSDPAEIAAELNRFGCNFNLDQPDADIFFDIMDAYEKANDLLRNEVYEKASEYLSENEKESLIEYLRDNIVDYMSTQSGKDNFERYYADMKKQAEQYLATAKQKAKDIVKLATLEAQIEHEKAKHAYDEKTKKLIAKLEQERREIEISAMQEAADAIEYNREYNNLISKVWSEADSLTLDKIKKYNNASDLLNNEFAGIIKKLAGIKWRGELKKHTTRKIIADFGKWYNTNNPLLTGGLEQAEIDRMMGDESVSSIGYLDKFVLQGIEIMKENQTRISKGGKTKGQPIPNNYDLTYDELLIARSVLASARHILKNYNTLQIAKQQVVLSETAIRTESLARKMSKVTHMKHKATDKALGAFMHTLTPSDVIAYMFGYQDNAMSDLFEQIQNGETHARAVEIDLKTIVEDFFKEHKKYKKTLSNAVKFGKYEVRKDIALSLYMHTLQKDSLEGLLLGGWGYRADDGYWKEQGKLTEADIKELKNALSENDKEFAKVLRKFFDKAGEAMVEADMQVKGYSLIDNENGNKNYYPIKRYSGDMAKTIADSEAIKNAMSVSVANFSFTKERVKNQRRIDVLPVMSVVNTHAKQVSLYNGLAMPIREFQRLYNVNIAQDGSTASVRNTLNESVWNGINKYLTTLLTDIQSEKGIKGENGAVSRVLGKVRSNYAKFQLGANPKTWFSQLSGYPAALPYLSVQSMAKAFTRSLHWKGTNAQNLMKYCEWARVKANDGGVVLVETLSDKLGMVGDIATKPIQSMDNFLNRIIWNAAQFEVERTTGHKFGSKENMERAAKLHTEIGRKTQGNSATSELAAMQRHQSEIVKGLAMFNSDGFKMVSRLFEAINRVRVQNYLAKNHPDMVTANSQKQARVFLAKTTTAILTSALIYTLVGELFKFLYDKDRKDKDGNEIDFAEDFGMSYLSTIVGMLPIVRDIYSLVVEGYDVDHYALEGFVDLATSFEGIVEGVTILASGEPFETQDIAKPLKDLVNALGLLTGIPTRNVYNTIYGFTKRFDASAAYEMDSIFYSQGFTADLKKAVESDDVDLQKTIIGLMLKDSGFTDTSEKVNVKLRELNAEGYSVLPKTIQDTLHYGETSYNLSSKQVKQFKSVYGQANADVEELVSDRHFTSLSAEVQAQAIKWIYDYYYECAVFNAIGKEADSKKQLFGETMDISKFALTIAACKAVESQLDKKGNVIAGSRKAQILKLLTKLNLTSAERTIILAYLGYSVGENEGILKAFIRKIGLTKQQQKLLLSYCGVA